MGGITQLNKDVKKQVEEILSTNESARNNDGLLFLIYLQKHDIFVHNKGDSNFLQVLNELKSVTRVRRKLQAAGLYEATKEVIAIRIEKEREISESMIDPDKRFKRYLYDC